MNARCSISAFKVNVKVFTKKNVNGNAITKMLNIEKVIKMRNNEKKRMCRKKKETKVYM